MNYLFFICNLYIAGVLINEFILTFSKKLRIALPMRKDIYNLELFKNILKKANYLNNQELKEYLIMAIGVFIFSFIVSFVIGILKGIGLGLFGMGILSFLIYTKKKNIEYLFQKNGYKLYKYIENQMEAGVLPKDALLNMHIVIKDKKLNEIIKGASAAFSISLNPKSASAHIERYVKTQESENFTMYLNNILFELDNKEVTNKLEQLMFNRYFAYVQRETDQVKTKSMLTVIIFCAIMVAMIGIPMYLDVQEALNSLFS